MVINNLLQSRIAYYKTNNLYNLIYIINKEYKNVNDLDILHSKSFTTKYNINYILSDSFTANDFSKLSKEFENTFKDSIKNNKETIDNMLLDMLLLIYINSNINQKRR